MEIRQAKPSEIKAVQSLDGLMWEDGFQHYDELYGMYPEGIWVAVENSQIAAYIGAERIAQRQLRVGVDSGYERSLPPWDHDPGQFHNSAGDVLYILGHGVAEESRNRGISNKLITAFLQEARKKRFQMAAVNHNLRHPQIRNPEEVWGKHGFNPLVYTYDPRWKHDADKPVDGSVVWAVYFHK